MVSKERRREVQAGGVALKLGCLHDTLVVGVAQRNAVRHVLEATRDCDVVVGGNGCAVDLLLPVGVGKLLLTYFIMSLKGLEVSVLVVHCLNTRNLNGVAIVVVVLICRLCHRIPSQSLVSLAVLAIEVLHELTILGTVHRWNGLFLSRNRHVSVVADLWLLPRASLLGGDDNHTVRCTRTVDSCCRSVLQYGEALDVVRVNH